MRPAVEIDLDGDGFGERQQQRLAARRRRDFENVAGAEIAQGDDPAELVALARHRLEADEIVVIEFVVRGGGNCARARRVRRQ